MDWTVGLQFPAGIEIFSMSPHRTGSRAHPALNPVGTKSSLHWGKWPGHESDHSSPSTTVVNIV
jgi:hypothetical protein